jgi:hypothetical protein
MTSACFRLVAKIFRFASCSIGVGVLSYIHHLRHIAQASRQRSYAALRSADDLAGSQLVFAEQSFVTRRPLNLVARVDRVYDNGKSLILVELKTRLTQDVYPSDIIELSAQRVALRHAARREVSDHALVLLVHPLLRKQTIRRVELIPEHLIISMVNRRKGLLSGLVEPGRPTEPTSCMHCEYRAECDKIEKLADR